MSVLESVRKAIERATGDFLRETVHLLAQGVMEAEVTELTGVPKANEHPTAASRAATAIETGAGNTRVGTIDPRHPRVRDGNYFPRFSNLARRAGACPARGRPGGIRARRLDSPGRRSGGEPRDQRHQRSEVSRICAALDAEVETFRRRPLTEGAYPMCSSDATYLKVREGGRVVSMAALVQQVWR